MVNAPTDVITPVLTLGFRCGLSTLSATKLAANAIAKPTAVPIIAPTSKSPGVMHSKIDARIGIKHRPRKNEKTEFAVGKQQYQK